MTTQIEQIADDIEIPASLWSLLEVGSRCYQRVTDWSDERIERYLRRLRKVTNFTVWVVMHDDYMSDPFWLLCIRQGQPAEVIDTARRNPTL